MASAYPAVTNLRLDIVIDPWLIRPMEELHSLRVTHPEKTVSEKVGTNFDKSGLLWARDRSWKAFHEIRAQLRVGMTEPEGQDVALATLANLGAKKHWHRPYLRFGAGTALSFHDSVQPTYQLQANDPVYIDIGPVWTDEATQVEYEGDVGDSFIFGENPEVDKCVQAVHRLFQEAQAKWNGEALTGQSLYRFLENRASELGYTLFQRVDGHRLSDYPHTKYSKDRLSQAQFDPTGHLWVLEIFILDSKKRYGAFFEDILQTANELRQTIVA